MVANVKSRNDFSSGVLQPNKSSQQVGSSVKATGNGNANCQSVSFFQRRKVLGGREQSKLVSNREVSPLVGLQDSASVSLTRKDCNVAAEKAVALSASDMLESGDLKTGAKACKEACDAFLAAVRAVAFSNSDNGGNYQIEQLAQIKGSMEDGVLALANAEVICMNQSSKVGNDGDINQVILNAIGNDADPEKRKLGEKIAKFLDKVGFLGQLALLAVPVVVGVVTGATIGAGVGLLPGLLVGVVIGGIAGSIFGGFAVEGVRMGSRTHTKRMEAGADARVCFLQNVLWERGDAVDVYTRERGSKNVHDDDASVNNHSEGDVALGALSELISIRSKAASELLVDCITKYGSSSFDSDEGGGNKDDSLSDGQVAKIERILRDITGKSLGALKEDLDAAKKCGLDAVDCLGILLLSGAMDKQFN